MKSKRFQLTFALWTAFFVLLLCSAAPARGDDEPKNLPIFQAWSGDYPVSQLNRLPESQRITPVGYLGTATVFADVWHAFKPGEKVPEVDFSKYLAVFSRNVRFYNRTSIAKVVLKGDVAEIISIETLSAIPIEDKVAMAMAFIPREGLKFLQTGNERIPIASSAPSADPLNATFTIGGQKVRLIDGHHEKEAAPGSAAKIKTVVFGEPTKGDLDGDGVEDAALFMQQAPGGSGTFYYVVAALNRKGTYRGMNGILLGDRISPQAIQIRNGVIVANYADRQAGEPMAILPSVGKTKYLILKRGQLEEIKPLGQGEQVIEGWVTIGHEVRSFRPCSGKAGLWILGNSPALSEIITAYHKALPDRKRFAHLFMVLAGKHADRPTEGLGREYEGSFLATQLVRVWPRGNCNRK